MKAKNTMKKFVSFLAVASLLTPNVANLGLTANADDAEQPVTYNDAVVMQTISSDQEGLAVNVGAVPEGAGITITQEAVPFDSEYLAIRFVSTYVDTSTGKDGYRPVKVYVNGTQIVGANDYASLEAYNPDGTKRANVELKWGGYLFLDPGFDGTIYFPKALLGEMTELTSLKVTFDAERAGELVITDVLGCNTAGAQVGKPVVNEKNLTTTVAGGATVDDGMVAYLSTDATSSLKIEHDAVAFDGEYLALDITVTDANNGAGTDAHAVFELYVNGNRVGTEGEDHLAIYNRNAEADYTFVQNMWPCWNFVPSGFDGIIYIPKALVGEITEITSIEFKGDGGHYANFTVNQIFSCDEVGANPIPTSGTLFKTDASVTMNATTISNTAVGSGEFVTGDSLALAEDGYVAVYVDTKSHVDWDTFTYIRMFANGKQVLENLGDIIGYPEDGSDPITVECKWGNWVVFPYDFTGVMYFPVANFFAGETELNSFKFEFDDTHTQEMDYKVGVASELGGTPTYLDLITPAKEATILVDYESYIAPKLDVDTMMDVKALSAENGAINDANVTMDEGVVAFDEFSYSYVKFGGISLEESWENQLVVSVKTQFEGGQPLNVEQHGDDYGYLEFTYEEGFDLASGLALNVQCLSGECYFRVYMIDEDGGVWQANHELADYTFVSDGAPIGMATLYNNFFFGEDVYGTLYIPAENFVASEFYNGEEITEPDTEMGKIVKVAIGMDMLYGLGRSMCVGAIANVDLENETFTRIFNPVEMTDEELGIPGADGTVVACNGSDLHVANFKLSREALEDTPNYEPPKQPDNEEPEQPEDPEEPEEKGCFGGIGTSALAMSGLVAVVAGVLMKRKEEE